MAPCQDTGKKSVKGSLRVVCLEMGQSH